MVCLGITHYIVETLVMKFLALILLSVFSCIFANAQPTKKVVTETGPKWQTMKEIYYVLKSDETIRQGSYELQRNGKPILQGYYNNGKKDSLWSYYGGSIVLSRKWYADGVRKGFWEFYNWKGEPEWQYDFSTGKATYQSTRTSADTVTYFYFTADNQWVRTKLDIPPIRLTGSGEWLHYLNRTLRYPDEAVNNEQMGTVLVAVTLDETGNATDYAIFQSATRSLDQEALRVVKIAENEYLPAEKDGKKVKSMYLVPIVFKLEVNK